MRDAGPPACVPGRLEQGQGLVGQAEGKSVSSKWPPRQVSSRPLPCPLALCRRARRGHMLRCGPRAPEHPCPLQNHERDEQDCSGFG